MKKAIILINAYSTLKSARNQAERLKEEFAALGVSVDIKENNFFCAHTDNTGKIVTATGGYDFCIYLDKDKYICEMLEKSGLRLFNSSRSIRLCDDKMTTHIALSENGVKMPETFAGLLCYDTDARLNAEALDTVEKNLGYPIIVKECYGSLGKGVYKADNRKQLNIIADKLKLLPHLFQRCITESCGKDIRVIVIGGSVIAAMQRISQKDFRSNIELGGVGEKIDVGGELGSLCIKVADILGLDYCGIDVLCAKDGYCICEVNSNAFFGGIEQVTGINVAKAYAEYIYGKIYGKRQ